MAMFYYSKPLLGIEWVAMTCTEAGTTLAYYGHAMFPAYGV